MISTKQNWKIQFIKNKYYSWYFRIIESTQNRSKPDGYTEIHHIFPTSIFGKNHLTVILTAKEHYICHLLLTKCFTGKNKKKMIRCVFLMMNRNECSRKKYTSKLYQCIREQWALNQSEFMNNKIAEGWKSPFSNKEIHAKTMKRREENKSNIFITNNPMFNNEYKLKKVKKTSGQNHYLYNNTIFQYNKDGEWITINDGMTLEDGCKFHNIPYTTLYKFLNNVNSPIHGRCKGYKFRSILNENKTNN